MRRWTPFPLERYIVHGAKERRLPKYMRVPYEDKTFEEDEEMLVSEASIYHNLEA